MELTQCDKDIAVLIACLTFDLRDQVRILACTHENLNFFPLLLLISNFFVNLSNIQAYADVLTKW